MARLSGRVDALHARVPIRVETLGGRLAALTTSAPDGSWSVELPAGDYVVTERWGATHRVSTAESAPAGAGAERYLPGSPGDSPRARQQRGGS